MNEHVSEPGTSGKQWEKALLIVGYLSLTAGVIAAALTPVRDYQLSIYAEVPTVFWIGIGVAILTAATVALLAGDGARTRDGGLLLSTLSVLTVIGLPVLRAYFFYGAGDSLSHLGWAREIQAGVISPESIVYPGVHLLSVEFATVSGIPIRTGMLTVVSVVIPLLFVIGFTACAYFITQSTRTAAVGALVAAMFIPINNVAVHPVVHSSSQAILLLPIVLLSLLLFLDTDEEGFSLAIPTGILLLLVSAGYLFIHPQEAMSYLAMLGGIAVLQFLVRRFRASNPIASLRPVYAHTFVIGVLFVTWIRQQGRAVSRLDAVIGSLLSRDPTVLTEASSRSTSLVDLGGSLVELYFKLFTVSTLMMILTGALVIALLVGAIDQQNNRRNALISVLSAALVFPTIGFFAIFVADQGDHYFRFYGFIMVTVSLLAVVAISMLASQLSKSEGLIGGFLTRERVWTALVFVFVAMVALQLATVHPSPYIYQPNDRVTETVMDGYDRTLEYHDGETSLTGVRGGPTRYIDAIYGTETASTLDFPGYESSVPESVFNTNVTSHYEEDRYLIVTTRTKQTEVDLYNGLRYQSSGFSALNTQPGSNRIMDNGGFTLYRLNGTEE